MCEFGSHELHLIFIHLQNGSNKRCINSTLGLLATTMEFMDIRSMNQIPTNFCPRKMIDNGLKRIKTKSYVNQFHRTTDLYFV